MSESAHVWASDIQIITVSDHLEKLTSGDLMKSSFARLAAVVSIKVVDSSIMMLPSGPTCKKFTILSLAKI